MPLQLGGVEPRGGRREAERVDEPAGGAADGHGDAAQAALELLVVDRVARLADLAAAARRARRRSRPPWAWCGAARRGRRRARGSPRRSSPESMTLPDAEQCAGRLAPTPRFQCSGRGETTLSTITTFVPSRTERPMLSPSSSTARRRMSWTSCCGRRARIAMLPTVAARRPSRYAPAADRARRSAAVRACRAAGGSCSSAARCPTEMSSSVQSSRSSVVMSVRIRSTRSAARTPPPRAASWSFAGAVGGAGAAARRRRGRLGWAARLTVLPGRVGVLRRSDVNSI